MIQKILNIGVYKNEKNETKKIRLLNGFCLVWNFFIPLFITADLLTLEDPTKSIFVHIISQVLILIVFFLQHKRQYLAARVLLISSITSGFYVYANILEPGVLMEYFYLLPPLMALLLINVRWVNLTILIISFGLFIVPDSLLHYYPEGMLQPVTILAVFVGAYVILNYSQNLNRKNEALLETEKRKALEANEKIEQQRQELEELNKFQSHFFINISHELRTPLTLIEGNNDKLMSLPAAQYNDQIKSATTIINTQSNKIKKIVDEVIDLTKMEIKKLDLQRKQLELGNFIKQLYHSFHSTFEHKGILFELQLDIPSTIISADSIYFERALNNVLLNALKYTEKGGKAIINVSPSPFKNTVSIVIEDTGIGIPLSEQEYIFNRFYQTDNDINKAGGSGVGLAFSKEVINLHKGEISVSSEEGKGTAFTIDLPVISYGKKGIETISPVIEETVENKLPNVLANHHYNILIVDDHNEMRQYIKSLLSGYNCLEAENGIDALSLISSHSIDYIITDYMMPKMDGYTLITEVKKAGLQVPILMLSARSDIEGKLKVLRLGIDDYLTKPFNRNELLIRISNGLNNYLAMSGNKNDTSDAPHPGDRKPDHSEEELNWLDSVRSFILENCYRVDFGLSDLFEEFAMSQSTLYRNIKSTTGLSPNEFIREVKLQEARRLVEEKKHDTIKQLAYAVGFQKTSHFSRLYEKRFGVKPVDIAKR